MSVAYVFAFAFIVSQAAALLDLIFSCICTRYFSYHAL